MPSAGHSPPHAQPCIHLRHPPCSPAVPVAIALTAHHHRLTLNTVATATSMSRCVICIMCSPPHELLHQFHCTTNSHRHITSCACHAWGIKPLPLGGRGSAHGAWTRVPRPPKGASSRCHSVVEGRPMGRGPGCPLHHHRMSSCTMLHRHYLPVPPHHEQPPAYHFLRMSCLGHHAESKRKA